jgi:hypothetical protein
VFLSSVPVVLTVLMAVLAALVGTPFWWGILAPAIGTWLAYPFVLRQERRRSEPATASALL